MIKAWLLQDTCQDCVYKFLRELRADVAFEYFFNIADSFSECIDLPDLKTSIRIGPCDERGFQVIENPGFLRTFGKHSFLTSPFSNTILPVRVKLLENAPTRTFHMTGRQTATLLSMLDLHARVLRAREWKQCRRAFSACLRERRVNDGLSLTHVMLQLVVDLKSLSDISPALSTAVAHFALLIFRGGLSVEMIQAYNLARETQGVSAHTFIIRHCFLRAPTPDTQAYAEHMYKKFINASPEERATIIEYTVEDFEHQYELSREEVDLAERWDIQDTVPEEEIVDYFKGSTITFEHSGRLSDRHERALIAADSTDDSLDGSDDPIHQSVRMELSNSEADIMREFNIDYAYNASASSDGDDMRHSIACGGTLTDFADAESTITRSSASSAIEH
ncbi:unnamed protein product [Euphydryas editha]|uniref:Uncharacterized protein n=1 Tax=Euphydryas editha TaxID=104508 RepID=A0AAU9TPL6_EUPED|nr:unnamed protein product [Euphydryas editha]